MVAVTHLGCEARMLAHCNEAKALEQLSAFASSQFDKNQSKSVKAERGLTARPTGRAGAIQARRINLSHCNWLSVRSLALGERKAHTEL